MWIKTNTYIIAVSHITDIRHARGGTQVSLVSGRQLFLTCSLKSFRKALMESLTTQVVIVEYE
jgi:hypothetical protein